MKRTLTILTMLLAVVLVPAQSPVASAGPAFAPVEFVVDAADQPSGDGSGDHDDRHDDDDHGDHDDDDDDDDDEGLLAAIVDLLGDIFD